MDKQLTYRNPLVYQRADPWVLYHDGLYYFTGSIPQYDCIELRCAKTLDSLMCANGYVVWRKHKTGEMGAHIWAPELHFINGKWYIYFTAGEAENIWEIRPYVLECSGDNPLEDEWIEKGRVENIPVSSFSLDMTSFMHRGRQYCAWAHTINPEIGSEIYLAEMENPWTLKSKPVLITSPQYDWEKQGFKVNEGPAVLIKNGKVILTYSASDTGWRYCMGMMWADENADLLDSASWHKSEKPVFKTSEKNSQFGPGHNCFTVDGEHDVMVYHCRNYKEIKGDPLNDPNRHARAIRFEYGSDGLPVFGEPPADTE